MTNTRGESLLPTIIGGGLLIGGIYLATLIFGGREDATASPTPAAETKDLSALCDDEPRFYSNTAAYTRTGPSPIVVFEPAGPNFHPVFLTETELAKAKPEIWRPDKARPQDVQLVACVSKPDEGEKVGSCTFTSNTFDLHRGEYEVTVYEAKTGKEVAQLEVRGKDSGGCPIVTTYREGSTPDLYTPMDLDSLQGALAPHVGD